MDSFFVSLGMCCHLEICGKLDQVLILCVRWVIGIQLEGCTTNYPYLFKCFWQFTFFISPLFIDQYQLLFKVTMLHCLLQMIWRQALVKKCSAKQTQIPGESHLQKLQKIGKMASPISSILKFKLFMTQFLEYIFRKWYAYN